MSAESETMNAADLVRRARAVLLDFDGPVTPLMPPPSNRHAADLTRAAVILDGSARSQSVRETTDHLAVLRYAAEVLDWSQVEAAESASIKAEIEAAATSRITPGAEQLLIACQRVDKPVVLVSNNSAEALKLFIARHRLDGLVYDVVGRPEHRPDLMKPDPHMVRAALSLLTVDAWDAVLIGDSVSDIIAARAAGVPTVGYAKTPARGAELADAGATAIIDRMTDAVP